MKKQDNSINNNLNHQCRSRRSSYPGLRLAVEVIDHALLVVAALQKSQKIDFC